MGGSELVVFGGLTLDTLAVKFRDKHTTNQACERVELVKPDTPELGDGGLGNRDTTKECEDDLKLKLASDA